MSMKTALDLMVVSIGGGLPGWDESYLGEGDVANLAGLIGGNFLSLAERWFEGLKARGGNPHDAISGSHMGIQALQGDLIAWDRGMTPNDVVDQVNVLKHQWDMVKEEITSGRMKPDETNIKSIRLKLLGFGVDPGPIPEGPPPPPPAPPGWEPTWQQAVEYVLLLKLPAEDGFTGGDIKALAKYIHSKHGGPVPGPGIG